MSKASPYKKSRTESGLSLKGEETKRTGELEGAYAPSERKIPPSLFKGRGQGDRLINTKTLVQCDFDGTVTEGDVSFLILDAFARGDWQQLFKDYEDGKISLGRFNTEAFSTVKADKKSLLELVRREAKVRPGLQELIASCQRKDYRFVIVSNGLRFYIDDIFNSLGIAGPEIFAAETQFHPDGLKVQYIGPDGKILDNDFKIAYANSFLDQGYRIIYLGDGTSDLAPARKSHRVFACAATGSLLTRCRADNLSCTPFTDLHQVAKVIESLE